MSRPPWGNDLLSLLRGLSRIGSAAAEIRSQEVTKVWATSSLRPLVAKGASNLQETITNAIQDPQLVLASVSKGTSEALSRISLVAEGIKAYQTQTAPLTSDMADVIQEAYDPIYDPNIQELSIEELMMNEALSGHKDHVSQYGDKLGADVLAGIGEIADTAVTNAREVKVEVPRRLDGFEPFLDISQLKESEITEEQLQAISEKVGELQGSAYGYNLDSYKDTEDIKPVDNVVKEGTGEKDNLKQNVVGEDIPKETSKTDPQHPIIQELSIEDVMMQEALSNHEDIVKEAVKELETIGPGGGIKGVKAVADVKSEAVQRAEEFDHLIDSLQFEEREITEEHLQAVNEKLMEIQDIAFGHNLKIFKETEYEKPVEDVLKEVVEENRSLKDATAETMLATGLEDTLQDSPKDHMTNNIEETEKANVIQKTVKQISDSKSTSSLSEKENVKLELESTIAQVAKSVGLGVSEKTIHDFDVEVQIEPKIETKPVSVTTKPLEPYPDLPGSKSPSGVSGASAATLALSGTALAVGAAAAAATIPGVGSAAVIGGVAIAATQYQEKDGTVEKDKSDEKGGQKKLNDIGVDKMPEVTLQVSEVLLNANVAEAVSRETSEPVATTVTFDVSTKIPEAVSHIIVESEAMLNANAGETVCKETPEPVASATSDIITETPEVLILDNVAPVTPEIATSVTADSAAPIVPKPLSASGLETATSVSKNSTATFVLDTEEAHTANVAAAVAATNATVTTATENSSPTFVPDSKDINTPSVSAAATTVIAATNTAAATTVIAAAVTATTVTAAASIAPADVTYKSVSSKDEKKRVSSSNPKPKLLGRKPLAKDKPKSTLAKNAQARKVPHSRIGRMLTFGGLAAGLGAGTIAEMTRRTLGVNKGEGSGSLLDSSPFLTEANAKRIVDTLCKVRGAALKLGQMLSIQDSSMINPQVQKIFERVRQSADFMPAWQLEKAISEQLGENWKSSVAYFDEKPFAAASIGQVHLVKLSDGRSAAMKVQYPGVAEGIESDINNLMSTLKLANIIPEGLYVDSVIEVAKRELGWECDYVREAACTEKYSELIRPYPEFYVPEVITDLCTQQIFTTELIEGIPVDKCVDMDQDTRNYISEKILHLCLLELFRFGFMQTDPNWSNFFYNADTEQLALLDFGACRSYDKSFVDKYIHVIHGAAAKDRGKILQYSKELGFLTGYEAKVMVDAHIDAIMILGEAFQEDKPFHFGSQDTTYRIHHLVPVMLSHRMCAPPEESYSLHRKLSGVFLLCAKLNGVVRCKPLFEDVFNTYKFGGTWEEFHTSLKL